MKAPDAAATARDVAITPYVGFLILGLVLVMFFPQTALRLPGTMQYK